MDRSNYMFMAAICRDIYEGGDGTKYFGSLLSWKYYRDQAEKEGWIRLKYKRKKDLDVYVLTDVGKKIGKECSPLLDGRAYAIQDQYYEAINRVLPELKLWD